MTCKIAVHIACAGPAILGKTTSRNENIASTLSAALERAVERAVDGLCDVIVGMCELLLEAVGVADHLMAPIGKDHVEHNCHARYVMFFLKIIQFKSLTNGNGVRRHHHSLCQLTAWKARWTGQYYSLQRRDRFSLHWRCLLNS